VRLWIDGREAPPGTPLDRGLEYGDGLFETIALLDGRLRLLERHLARLALGCERLALPAPGLQLREELLAVARAGGTGTLKLIVTRGAGGAGYRSEPSSPARRTLALLPPRVRPVAWARDGVRVRLCALRLAEQPRLAGLKHLNRLEQVLARAEWTDPDIAEGLMLDVQGRLVCGTMTNVFLRFGTELVTPMLARAGVAGVMRAAVTEALARAGVVVRERDVAAAELARADELFLTNALIGAWPVCRIGERELAPGPVARQVQALVAAF
jgi:4-amino-4-deoxychorismate lyase